MTQRAVAGSAGMDFSYYSRLENDRFKSRPTLGTIERLAGALDCQPYERQRLLVAAGRFDPSTERLLRAMSERPDLVRLLNAAMRLPKMRVAALVRAAERTASSGR
jgi:transcriptional regulator with XRE-family HTH domain